MDYKLIDIPSNKLDVTINENIKESEKIIIVSLEILLLPVISIFFKISDTAEVVKIQKIIIIFEKKFIIANGLYT